MTTLFLVRHAQSEANAATSAQEQDSDSPLTVRGHAQAAALAHFFANEPITHVFSSDAKRAEATALAIATRACAPTTVTSLLREPVSARRPTEVVNADAAAALLAQLERGASSGPRVRTETHGDVVARLRTLLERLPPAGRTVIVSHFVTLNVLYRILTEEDPKPGLALHLDNGSVTRIDGAPGAAAVVYANFVPPG